MTLIFAAGSSSSLEVVVKLQVELEGVTAFCFPVLADFLSLAAFACLSYSFSYSTACFSASISLTACPGIGDGALDTLDTLPLPSLIVITNG